MGRAFSNAYRSMPFACASGLWQATSPASWVFSTAIDPALEYSMVEISEESLQINCLSTLSLSWGGSKFLKTPLDLRR